MPLSPQGHKAGRDPQRAGSGTAHRRAFSPSCHRNLTFCQAARSTWRGDTTAFSRPTICIFPLLFMCTFIYAHFQSIRNLQKAHASTTMLFCSDPHQQATSTNVHKDWGQDLLSYREQMVPEWTKLGLSAVEKVRSKSCSHWDGSLEWNMVQVYILMKQC